MLAGTGETAATTAVASVDIATDTAYIVAGADDAMLL